jgi:hypothetical protein
VTPLAAVVLAHSDPAQLRRLIRALDDVPVFLSCDAGTPQPIFRAMVEGLPTRVAVLTRRRTRLASWSLVSAELATLRHALMRTNARHIAVMSGADYPLMSMHDLVRELAGWGHRSWFASSALPAAEWDTPRQRDGGLWRLRYRYLTHRDQLVYWRGIGSLARGLALRRAVGTQQSVSALLAMVDSRPDSMRGVPLRWPWPRRIPADITPRGASHWKIYAREDVAWLLRMADTRPDLVRFWRNTVLPEESFAASMLASVRLRGADALPPYRASAWYIDWNSDRPGHPRWLSETDFDRLRAARWAPAVRDQAGAVAVADDSACRKLFARKFRSNDASVCDRIDSELRKVDVARAD